MEQETTGYLAEYEQFTEILDPPRWIERKLMRDTPEEIAQHIRAEKKRVPHRIIRKVRVFRLIREPFEMPEGLI